MAKKFGFGHVNTYARATSKISNGKGNKWSAKNIFGEASRVDENSPHVVNPQAPIHIHGTHPSELEAKLESFCESNADKYITKGGKQATRKIRADKHVLLAAVYSWPESTENFDEAQFNEFAQECIKFFENEHGVKAESAVVHLDEAYPHVHVYGFSTDARNCHAGWRAKKQWLIDNPKDEKGGNVAYKEAMRGFQDRYFEQVTQKFAMDRLGPNRQRLSRGAWFARKDELRIRSRLEELSQQVKAISADLVGKKEEHEAVSLSLESDTEKLSRVRELVVESSEHLGKVKNELAQAESGKKSAKAEAANLLAHIGKKEKDLDVLEQNLATSQTLLDDANTKVKQIELAGGTWEWAKKTAYAVIGKDTPALAKAKREAAEAEAKREKAALLAKQRQDALKATQDELKNVNTRLAIIEKRAELKDDMLRKAQDEVKMLRRGEAVLEVKKELADYVNEAGKVLRGKELEIERLADRLDRLENPEKYRDEAQNRFKLPGM